MKCVSWLAWQNDHYDSCNMSTDGKRFRHVIDNDNDMLKSLVHIIEQVFNQSNTLPACVGLYAEQARRGFETGTSHTVVKSEISHSYSPVT